MPHEHINSADDNCSRIRVSWKPVAHGGHVHDEPEMGYVQLMSENAASPARFPSEQMISTGAPHPGAPEEFIAGAPTWTEPCTGFAATLDRDGINRTIRMLRRARDAAFGTDA